MVSVKTLCPDLLLWLLSLNKEGGYVLCPLSLRTGSDALTDRFTVSLRVSPFKVQLRFIRSPSE